MNYRFTTAAIGSFACFAFLVATVLVRVAGSTLFGWLGAAVGMRPVAVAAYCVLHPAFWLVLGVVLALAAVRTWTTRGRSRSALVLAVLALAAFAPANVGFPVALVNANLTSYDATGMWPVLRLGVDTIGDAPAAWFKPQSGTCATNGLVADVGTCNDDATGSNSWIAVYPGGRADVREWGCLPTVTNNYACIQAAFASLGTVYNEIDFGGGTFDVTQVPVVVGNGTNTAISTTGNGSKIVGFGGVSAGDYGNPSVTSIKYTGGSTAATLTGSIASGVLTASSVTGTLQLYDVLQDSTAVSSVSWAQDASTVTITIASPAVVTWTAHGFSNSSPQPLVFSTSGALPTGITAGTVYWTIPASVTTNTFEVATSVANANLGTAVDTSGSQSGTQTATVNAATVVTSAASPVTTVGQRVKLDGLVNSVAGQTPLVDGVFTVANFTDDEHFTLIMPGTSATIGTISGSGVLSMVQPTTKIVGTAAFNSGACSPSCTGTGGAGTYAVSANNYSMGSASMTANVPVFLEAGPIQNVETDGMVFDAGGEAGWGQEVTMAYMSTEHRVTAVNATVAPSRLDTIVGPLFSGVTQGTMDDSFYDLEDAQTQSATAHGLELVGGAFNNIGVSRDNFYGGKSEINGGSAASCGVFIDYADNIRSYGHFTFYGSGGSAGAGVCNRPNGIFPSEIAFYNAPIVGGISGSAGFGGEIFEQYPTQDGEPIPACGNNVAVWTFDGIGHCAPQFQWTFSAAPSIGLGTSGGPYYFVPSGVDPGDGGGPGGAQNAFGGLTPGAAIDVKGIRCGLTGAPGSGSRTFTVVYANGAATTVSSLTTGAMTGASGVAAVTSGDVLVPASGGATPAATSVTVEETLSSSPSASNGGCTVTWGYQ